ncbi:unnamed protein product [Nezara viridula]|uniref:Purine nucleoside phosphorylase n=1 Tax=Nezara viridula TaxID=85310 RepID=A0A9P0H948_NEZVI|nr:unnamed protein product [Nezara viridula]
MSTQTVLRYNGSAERHFPRQNSLSEKSGPQPLKNIGNVADFTRPQKNKYTYEVVEGIAKWLQERTSIKPKIGIICGTGLGGLTDEITDKEEFPYTDIPLFPSSTVAGHAGKLVFGRLEDKEVICCSGRFHYYEGYNNYQVTLSIRVMKILGVTHLVMSNAAGGLPSDYNVGDIMILKDHINFIGMAGGSPLRGPNDERWGERFISTTHIYNKEMREQAKKAAEECGLGPYLKEGVYCMVGGPNFETVAECRMLKLLGGDAVGMSTVAESLVAAHSGITVFAFSLITNMCCMEYDDQSPPNHEEHLMIGKQRTALIQAWVRNLVGKIQLNQA